MKGLTKDYNLLRFNIAQDERFPDITLPVLLYKGILDLPWFQPAKFIKKLFSKHHWINFWKDGVLTYHHFHSKTHEVLGFYGGETTLCIGGKDGEIIQVEKGDVLVIPAGIAHKNLGKQHQIKCVGAYPDGVEYDILTGKGSELSDAIQAIKNVPMPDEDPVLGTKGGITRLWKTKKKAS